jgi:hypothetical protein
MRIRRDMRFRFGGWIVIAAFCAAVVTVGLFVTTQSSAASIPAWLDDAIAGWNAKNPAQQFQFSGIKDSFVWYRIERSPEVGQKQIRDASYRLLQEHGYMVTDEEELVTTGTPPVDSGRATPKKCWRRSFVLTLDGAGNNTTAIAGERSGVQQRLLTSMICDDNPSWAAGFRVSQ